MASFGKKEEKKPTEKPKDLAGLLAQVNKACKEEGETEPALRMLFDNAATNVVPITTGSLALDAAIGIGGFPRGRIIEIYGPEASGKTTLTLATIAAEQAAGGVCAFLDMEHAMDPKLMVGCGIDTTKLIFSQPKHGEQCFDILRMIVESGKVSLVVVDSVAAMTPKKELEGEMEDANMGEQARMMGKGLRKISGLTNQTKTTVIFINQLREKIGVMFGSPETTPGGKALKFYASVRLDVRKKEVLTDSSQKVIGNNVKVKVVKNKVSNPFAETHVNIIFGKGVDNSKDIAELGEKFGLIKKAGSFYQYLDNPKSNGIPNFSNWLRENPLLLKEITAKIGEAIAKSKGAFTPDSNPEVDGEEPAE